MGYALKVSIHLLLVFLAFIASYHLREGLPLTWLMTSAWAPRILAWACIYTGIAFLVEMLFQSERASWRFSSARDAVKLARSTALSSVLFLIVIFLSNRADFLSRSVLVINWVFALATLVGVRLVWRAIHDPSLVSGLFSGKQSRNKTALLLIGDLRQAEAHLRKLAADPNAIHYPVAIITIGQSGVGQLVHGVRVVDAGGDLMGHVKALSTGGPSATSLLFLDEPIEKLGLSSQQIGALKAEGFKLLRQPSLLELMSEPTGTFREIKLEEFLQRAPVSLDPQPVADMIRGRRVLVTGAGGSIGSEIARQLVTLGCDHITLVDHSEFLLFEIDRELSNANGCTRRAVLCNVRDEGRVAEVFAEERPDIIFHAAALKHVTLVENNPSEGILTNVIGTWNVGQAARNSGASQLVLISTDKAVSPTNVMGATKRIAEAAVAAFACAEMACCAVRFGNVLGSAGSVVPIFKDQIERGGPVTITDEAVERYFMTIPEAVQLVMHAASQSALGPRGVMRKFVLEMGQPVKIIDLARQMIALSGRASGKEIAIEIVGLRPGEKLTEELLDSSETATPCLPGVNEISSATAEINFGPANITAMANLARQGDAGALRAAISKTLLAAQVIERAAS